MSDISSNTITHQLDQIVFGLGSAFQAAQERPLQNMVISTNLLCETIETLLALQEESARLRTLLTIDTCPT